MIIKSGSYDSEWENYFGSNYNIEISSDRMPFEVIKGQLSFEVADAEKFYGTWTLNLVSSLYRERVTAYRFFNKSIGEDGYQPV